MPIARVQRRPPKDRPSASRRAETLRNNTRQFRKVSAQIAQGRDVAEADREVAEVIVEQGRRSRRLWLLLVVTLVWLAWTAWKVVVMVRNGHIRWIAITGDLLLLASAAWLFRRGLRIRRWARDHPDY